MGGVFATNLKAYRRWRSRHTSAVGKRPALRGAALEAAIMGIAQRFPGQVIRGVMPAKQQGGDAHG